MNRRRFFPTPPPSISTDLSVTRSDPHEQRRTPRWEEKRQAQSLQAAQAMALLQQMEAHLGGVESAIKAPPLNDVKWSGARIVGVNGFDVLEWPEAISALTIANVSSSLLTVGTSASGSSAPGVGAGVMRIPPGRSRTFAHRGNGLRVFGNPGAAYDLIAWARPRPPASGLCGRSQGGVLIPAGATTSQTVTFAGADLGHIAVVLSVTAVAAGSVQVTINGVTPSGYVYPLLVGLAVNAVSVTPYRIGPGLTPSPNAVADDLVPETIQVVTTVVAAATYGVDLVAGA